MFARDVLRPSMSPLEVLEALVASPFAVELDDVPCIYEVGQDFRKRIETPRDIRVEAAAFLAYAAQQLQEHPALREPFINMAREYVGSFWDNQSIESIVREGNEAITPLRNQLYAVTAVQTTRQAVAAAVAQFHSLAHETAQSVYGDVGALQHVFSESWGAHSAADTPLVEQRELP